MREKTTKENFKDFKKACVQYADLLGLKEYKICFLHEKLEESYARIEVNHRGMVAWIALTTEFEKDVLNGWCGPTTHAKHEILHLLVSRLVYLGESRFIAPDEITTEEERVVRRLESVIP